MTARHEMLYYVRLVQRRKKTRIDLSGRVLAFTFEDNERKADKMVLTVDNWDMRNFDTPVWAKGNDLEVSWGYVGNMAPARQVTITKVTGSTTLKVEGVSKSFIMDRVPRSRTFENRTRSEVVQTIAAEYGYGDTVRDIDDTEDKIRTISQPSITDAAFLRRLANKEGFEFYIDFDGFHWHERRTKQLPKREYIWFTDKTGTLMDYTLENDVTARPGFVRVKGRDLLEKKDFSVDTLVKTVLANAPDVIGHIDQARAIMKSEDSPPAEKKKAAIFVLNEQTNPNSGQRAAAHKLAVAQRAARAELKATAEADAAAAEKKAKGTLRRKKQLTIKLKGKVVGDPGLIAKTVLRIGGIGERLSGNYYVKSVKHSITSGGYICDMKCIRDGQNRMSARLFEKVAGGGGQGIQSNGSCERYVAMELGITKTLWDTWKNEAQTYTAEGELNRAQRSSLLLNALLQDAKKIEADNFNAAASQRIFNRCLKLQALLKPTGPTYKAITALRMPSASATSLCNTTLIENIGSASVTDDRAVTAVTLQDFTDDGKRKAFRIEDKETGIATVVWRDVRGRQ